MRYLIAIVLSVVLLIGCGEQKSSKPVENADKFAYDSSDIQMQPADNQNEQFSLEYKFSKGNPFTYRVTMISDMTQTVVADTTMNMDMHQTMVYLIHFNPLDTDAEGNTELTCSITSSKIEMEGNGRKIEYNSDSIKTSEDKEKFADNHSMVNNPFSVRINKRGELLEVYKADKIVNSYLEFRKLTDSATTDDKANLRNQMIETMLKPLITTVFSRGPEKELSKDSSWTFEQPKRQMLVFQVEQTNRYKVKQIEKLDNKRIAVVEMGMNARFNGESKVTERGINYNFEKPDISAKGTLYFNIDDGCVQKAKKETLIKTSFTAEGPSPMGVKKTRNSEVIKTQNFIERL